MAPKRKATAAIGYSDATGAKSNKRSTESTPRKSARQTTLTANGDITKPNNKKESKAGAASGQKSTDREQFDHSRIEESLGIVQRDFYPPEMSNERCAMYNNNEIPRPIEVLESALAETERDREKIEAGNAVIHWFKRDLRLNDNRALEMASKKAQEQGVPLICMYILSPQDYQAHLTSAARVDFELRTLATLKDDLGKLDIPLHVTTVEKRKNIPGYILDLCQSWGANHVYCGIEYEVDELRREASLIRKLLQNGINLTAVHDDVVVPPGQLKTGQGRQYAVYTPWFRAWIAHIHTHPHLLKASDPPACNPKSARSTFSKVFAASIPTAPENKRLDPKVKERMESLWPAGEAEAHARLDRFLAEKVGKYKLARNFPSGNSTATVSMHHSAGTLAARTSVRKARDCNSTKKLDKGNEGITTWISEVAWRDFYKHVLVHWPYVCMHKPFKYEYTNIEWEYNDEHFKRWCEGRTGFPIVDAAMRQLAHSAYMHNRCRMIVASFLAKDLLLDWRMGERFFMESLIDGDFASNNGGWGFSASTGVDPQPYFRIFNPLLQSEKFDPDGDYIRKWVKELRNVEGKAIHDPYGRGAGKQAEKNGYPMPMVKHSECRERALQRYKTGIGRTTA